MFPHVRFKRGDVPLSSGESLKKPRLRGYLHQEAFFTSLGAGALLIAKSSGGTERIASVIYTIGLLCLFGISALYHRIDWEPRVRAFVRRFDHSAIFIFIAGTFTPICLLSLPSGSGHRLLLIVWSAAFFGILQCFFWSQAPRWFTALFYVAVGWLALPYLDELKESLGRKNVWLLVTGMPLAVLSCVGCLRGARNQAAFRDFRSH